MQGTRSLLDKLKKTTQEYIAKGEYKGFSVFAPGKTTAENYLTRLNGFGSYKEEQVAKIVQNDFLETGGVLGSSVTLRCRIGAVICEQQKITEKVDEAIQGEAKAQVYPKKGITAQQKLEIMQQQLLAKIAENKRQIVEARMQTYLEAKEDFKPALPAAADALKLTNLLKQLAEKKGDITSYQQTINDIIRDFEQRLSNALRPYWKGNLKVDKIVEEYVAPVEFMLERNLQARGLCLSLLADELLHFNEATQQFLELHRPKPDVAPTSNRP